MQRLKHFFIALWQDERGQGTVEHSFIMAFIAAMLLGVYNLLCQL